MTAPATTRTALVTALASGALLALGLLVSGMTDPAKILGFLDVTSGHWDPSLAFVMGGALLVHAPIVRLVRARPAPLFDARFHWPRATRIDLPLVLGAALFGVGWGLTGYCPGPALVSAAGGASILIFLAAMVVGIVLGRLAVRRLAAR
jgi:uncharacterized membrane protein YedE/YeeE